MKVDNVCNKIPHIGGIIHVSCINIMSNFRYRLREATKILATHPGEIKYRIASACLDHLVLANLVPDEEIPVYFRDKLDAFLKSISTKKWAEHLEGDRIRATLHGTRGKTLSKIANEIWVLYNEFEEYLHSGFIPEHDS